MISAQSIIAAYLFILGLCFGSFLNVVILRGLSGDEIVFARSKCPKCLKQLKWYMNIPLLSFLFLRGRCAFCKEPISIQYPIVEFLCGFLFSASYIAFGLTWKTFFVCIFLALFIIMATTDFLQTVVIDLHSYILAFCALLYSLLHFGDITFLQSIFGAVFGFLIFEIFSYAGVFLVKKRAFGEGDSLIAIGLGAIFGIKNLLLIIFLAFLLQSLFSIPFLVKNMFLQKKYRQAFSYLAVAVSLVLLILAKTFFVFKYEKNYLIFICILGLVLFYSLCEIIADIKNKSTKDDDNTENFFILPFGPAFLISAALGIFFLKEIKAIVFNLFL